jgi:phosphoserine phosphatase
VSGGFTCFAGPVAKKLGFDKSFANSLIVREGRLTGEIAEPILDKDAKKALMEQACAEQALTLSDVLAVGDGANDIPMLLACHNGGGLGVAYHAKPNVCSVVSNQINHGDLTVLAYTQKSAPQGSSWN